jgi:hypothetical protein
MWKRLIYAKTTQKLSESMEMNMKREFQKAYN